MRIDKCEFTIFDVETTGLYPYSGDRICEIAAIRVNSSLKRLKKYSSLVDPGRPISYGAFSVNRITAEMVAGKPVIEKILPRFFKLAEGSVLVAYNAGFDIGFLESAAGARRPELDGYIIVDALALARRFFPAAGRYGLGVVSRYLGIESPVEHRAMADVLMTMKVFEKELEIIGRSGIESIEEIAYPRKRVTAAARSRDPRIRLIEEAIRDQKRLNIKYRSSWNNEVTERVVSPRQIQNGYDRSYLIAYCHLRKTERNFRVDCIVDARAE